MAQTDPVSLCTLGSFFIPSRGHPGTPWDASALRSDMPRRVTGGRPWAACHGTLGAIHSGLRCPLRDGGAGDTRLTCESNDALWGSSGVSRGYSCFYRAICSLELPCSDALKGLWDLFICVLFLTSH